MYITLGADAHPEPAAVAAGRSSESCGGVQVLCHSGCVRGVAGFCTARQHRDKCRPGPITNIIFPVTVIYL
eukprot:5141141-Amphidinium_carterae.1